MYESVKCLIVASLNFTHLQFLAHEYLICSCDLVKPGSGVFSMQIIVLFQFIAILVHGFQLLFYEDCDFPHQVKLDSQLKPRSILAGSLCF